MTTFLASQPCRRFVSQRFHFASGGRFAVYQIAKTKEILLRPEWFSDASSGNWRSKFRVNDVTYLGYNGDGHLGSKLSVSALRLWSRKTVGIYREETAIFARVSPPWKYRVTSTGFALACQPCMAVVTMIPTTMFRVVLTLCWKIPCLPGGCTGSGFGGQFRWWVAG